MPQIKRTPHGTMRQATADVFYAFEKMSRDPGHEEGMKAKDTWIMYGKGTLKNFQGQAVLCVELGLLTMTGPVRSGSKRYRLSPNFAETLKGLRVLRKYTHPRRRRTQNKPRVPAPAPEKQPGLLDMTKANEAPGFPEPTKVKGLAYIPNNELRAHLGKVIEGLELVKEHIGPTLTLLLDLDGNFDRFTDVSKRLAELKAQFEDLRL